MGFIADLLFGKSKTYAPATQTTAAVTTTTDTSTTKDTSTPEEAPPAANPATVADPRAAPVQNYRKARATPAAALASPPTAKASLLGD